MIATREGNPKHIRDWEDLTRPDVEVLYPNPKTSGGAMWCVNAIYGAGLRLAEPGTGSARLRVAARDLVKRIQARVKVMDKSGRESVTTFERGIGDALVTYENEVLLRGMQGRPLPFVIPRADHPDREPGGGRGQVRRQARGPRRGGGVRAVPATATWPSGRSRGTVSVRPARTIMQEVAKRYPAAPLQFDIGYLGGWTQVRDMLYGPQGVWTEVTQELGQGR